ncbi:uncharacterized protein J3D65DRAFT_172340 [Phyllosticta citribraziliensis]|uniref:Uncharacterized protein n=1 Tax=Phyllosticta citribraziliensis TaxID=989973 RepID=A0ABR1L2Y2_9PEZI
MPCWTASRHLLSCLACALLLSISISVIATALVLLGSCNQTRQGQISADAAILPNHGPFQHGQHLQSPRHSLSICFPPSRHPFALQPFASLTFQRSILSVRAHIGLLSLFYIRKCVSSTPPPLAVPSSLAPAWLLPSRTRTAATARPSGPPNMSPCLRAPRPFPSLRPALLFLWRRAPSPWPPAAPLAAAARLPSRLPTRHPTRPRLSPRLRPTRLRRFRRPRPTRPRRFLRLRLPLRAAPPRLPPASLLPRRLPSRSTAF